jgi:hypothetical protein
VIVCVGKKHHHHAQNNETETTLTLYGAAEFIREKSTHIEKRNTGVQTERMSLQTC